MHNFSPLTGAIGGILIGISSTMMMLFVGRITGISGIFGGVVTPRAGEFTWRMVFLAGLLVGGGILLFAYPPAFPTALPRSMPILIVAGLLVGFGTRMGSGCTSGHGVCGLARFSPRSLVSVLTFLSVGMITVFVFNMVMAG